MTIINSSLLPQPRNLIHAFHHRKREMSSSAKDDSRSSFDKLRLNFLRTSRPEEMENVEAVESQDESQSSPTRCTAESSGSSNYQPLENLSKLVDSAPSMKEVTKLRSEGLSKWNSIHVDPDGAKTVKSSKPSPPRHAPTTNDHKTSLDTTRETHDEKRQKKRKVFSIADILDPHFGSKSPIDSKRTRFDHSQPTRTPYLQTSLPVPYPAANPVVCGMLEQHTETYFWNFCQTNSLNHLLPKLEKENATMCNNRNSFNNYLPIPLHPNLFYHHPSIASYHLPYPTPPRQVKPPTPPLERFSGDTRSQQESLKLILANKDKGSTFAGSADTGEYHNNHRRPPSSPPRPPTTTTAAPSRPHKKSEDRTPGLSAGSQRSTASLDKTSDQNRAQMPPKLWPAWVYCTRYSDRPSSGPRTRKPRRKTQKSSTNASIQQTSSSSSSSSAVDDKRPRTAFNQEQLAILKKEFAANQYLTEERRISLSSTLGLNESQIKIWFQNKRAKLKKSSGIPNRLAIELMAQGLYNHSTLKSSQQKSGATSPSSSSSRSPAAF